MVGTASGEPEWQWVAGELTGPQGGAYGPVGSIQSDVYPGSRFGGCPFFVHKLTNDTAGSSSPGALNWTVAYFGGAGCGPSCADDLLLMNDLWLGEVYLGEEMLALWLWLTIGVAVCVAIFIPVGCHFR